MSPGLSAKPVFLTGASGFIGARLAECLATAYGASVHALVHRIGTVGTARLARLRGVRLFQGDVRDPAAIERAAAGCGSAIHCAASTSGNPRQQRQTEVLGARHVAEVVRHHGMARVVYLSSAMVHDVARAEALIQEDAPLNGHSAYARAKIQAEALLRRQPIPVVILRPSAVWGPWSPTWAVAATQLIRRRVAFLPQEGRGAANTVYVDNLVDAVYLALTREEAIGQVFLVNDDEPRTWGEFYGAYARALGVPLQFVSSPQGLAHLVGVSAHNLGVLMRRLLTGRSRWGRGLLRECYDQVPAVKSLLAWLPDDLTRQLKQRAAQWERVSEEAPVAAESDYREYPMIAPSTRQLYSSSVRYANEKAKRLLGWRQRVVFPEAMAKTCEWLAYAGFMR